MPLTIPRAAIPGVNISSWNTCMSKAYCKWPVIIGIIITSVVLISIIWCCARCLCCGLSCCCCGGGRRNNRPPKYADPPPQNFQPAPYQGYEQPPAGPGYGPPTGSEQGYRGTTNNQGYNSALQQPAYEPPQFAQFDVNKKPVNEDALPEMPSWENASTRKVLDEHHEDMELGILDPAQAQRTPMLATQIPSPTAGYAEADSHALNNPYETNNAYSGGDLGSPQAQRQTYGAPSQSRWAPGQRQQAYTDQPAQPAYSAYSPAGSTRYAPSSSAYEAQEAGTVYASKSPPPQQQPSILQAGRKPVPNTWSDV